MGKMVLDQGWLAARRSEVRFSGVELTTTQPPVSAQLPWMEAVIPGTVLATLVKNKQVPDPFYGLQNEAILDIGDSGREYYTFWFFRRFDSKLSRGQHAYLNFRAINYSGEIFLNGHKELLPKGMFRRHSVDVTDIINPDGENLLAVLIYPPDHPGKIPPQGGQGGDHEIGKDVATQYVEGWDWVIPIRDRNTGIWDEVSLCITGPVRIVDPHLVCTFLDNYKRSYLYTTLDLENKGSSDATCSIEIQVGREVEGDTFLINHLQTQEVVVPATSSVQYTFPKIFFYKPDLWWPNGMGKQSLYNVEITISVQDHGESDSWSQHFGFRNIESHIDTSTGGRLFKVNGERIFIRGGNWIVSDGLLRLSKERYKADIRFHADMNFNMIRCWGGGISERPEFYHYCDIYGILVWQEFWITGDVDGRGDPISNVNGPLDHALFLLCARDTIKLLRNHPSLTLWVGGNEQVPPKDLNDALKEYLKLSPLVKNSTEVNDSTEASIDPSQYLDGTRVYIEGSMWDGFADGKGNWSDGPYGIQTPEDFFKDDFYAYGFNPEVGSVGMPVAATIRATMPPEGWTIPLFQVSDGNFTEVPNPIWTYHKYIPYSNKNQDHVLLYGMPRDLDDFCLKAQLANYIQYRALLEGWTSRMWKKYTGVLIWKNMNPWTGLRGQFYDHLLNQTAGFYGCRCAAEPIHVQLNLATFFVEVVNTTNVELSDVAIEASVWDLEGGCPYHYVFNNLTVPSKTALSTFEMQYPKSINPEQVYFLLLKLYNIKDYSILSRNLYWLHLPGGDYKLLEPYRQNKISLGITSQTRVTGSSYEIKLQIENKSKNVTSPGPLLHNSIISAKTISCLGRADSGAPKCLADGEGAHTSLLNTNTRTSEMNGTGKGVAFFLHLSVHDSTKDQETSVDTRILPVHYSDNYFSLAPGEVLDLRLEFEAPAGTKPRVMLDGWNIEGGQVPL